MRLCSHLSSLFFGIPAPVVPGLAAAPAPAVTLKQAHGSARMGPGARKTSARHSRTLPLNACENALLQPFHVTGLNDNQVSHEFWNTVNDVPTERTISAESLGTPETKLQHIRRHGRR